MKNKLITMSLFLALSTLASARLGETEAQCEARYGEVNSVGKDGARYFSKNGIFLTVRLDSNGKANYLCYSNADGSELSVEHARILVNANGVDWVERGVSETCTVWELEDKVAFTNKSGDLFVMTEAKWSRLSEAMNKRLNELNTF